MARQIRATFLMSLLLVVGTAMIVVPQPTLAATQEHCNADNSKSSSFLGIPTWYKYLQPRFNETTKECELTFPDNDITHAIGPILLAVVEILLRIGTYLAVSIVIWGGIQYQLSQGEPERTKNARTIIINALVGLVIAISATAIVNLVGRNIF